MVIPLILGLADHVLLNNIVYKALNAIMLDYLVGFLWDSDKKKLASLPTAIKI